MKNLIQKKKNNVRLFPLYKMLSLDLLFYTTFEFLFLVEVKGFAVATILFLNSFYYIVKVIMQIPCITLVEKNGNRNSLIIANLSLLLSVIIFIFARNTFDIGISYALMASSFVTKDLSENGLLYDSMTTRKGKNLFAKIDGLGNSYFYYLQGISTVLSGFLFSVNAYIPFVFCVIFVLLSTIISFRFQQIVPIHKKKPNEIQSTFTNFRNYFSELKTAFYFIFRSSRLKSVMLLFGVCSGIMYLIATYRKSLYTDMGVSAAYLGIIFAIFYIIMRHFVKTSSENS